MDLQEENFNCSCLSSMILYQRMKIFISPGVCGLHRTKVEDAIGLAGLQIATTPFECSYGIRMANENRDIAIRASQDVVIFGNPDSSAICNESCAIMIDSNSMRVKGNESVTLAHWLHDQKFGDSPPQHD